MITIVSDDQENIGAMAIMTPPFPMIVQSEPLNVAALESLADALISGGWKLSGVNGVTDASDAFAQIWRKKTGHEVRLLKTLRAYELRNVQDLDYLVGKIRVAEERDAQKAADMLSAMQEELKLEGSNSATFEGALISIHLKRTFFWVVDGEVVSTTISVRPQIKGICISGVYTPPEHRQRGYARALVAQVSKEMLSRGFELTNLFTDLSNPTSN
ncbi:MAG: GNAT family N-acetyltransferase, partial [Chloroflexi bacterium]|nr:GNAT family N-acetyltransferase [Chloroflexota bacterium]